MKTAVLALTPLVALLFSLNSSLAATPATVTDSLASFYQGTCTPDGRICGHFAPTEIPVHAVASYLKSAQHSIRIATYNMDVLEYTDLLIDKLNAGVKVEFGLDYKHAVEGRSVWSKLPAHANLKRLRLPVLRGGNPQMHNKMILIDDQIVLFGSANFTYSGLVANYENVMAIKDASTVAKFRAEFEELMANADEACRLFGTPASGCGQASETWDENFNLMTTEARLPANVFKTSTTCRRVAQDLGRGGAGFLDERNLPKRDFLSCLKPGPFQSNLTALFDHIRKTEKYVDGTRTDSAAMESKIHPKNEIETYFSPEDDTERVIVDELKKTLVHPKTSFAFLATNFITNGRIAETLEEMHDQGVRVVVFIDRGRYYDPNFQQQMAILKKIGAMVFDNQLTGPYGCNHNKMAIVGAGTGHGDATELTLINGSANWSSSAFRKNDENVVLLRQQEAIAIYSREILSQHFVYQFAQQSQSSAWLDFKEYLTLRIPCLTALLVPGESCVTSNGATWQPELKSTAILSLENAPVDANQEQLWAWVARADGSTAFLPLFTHEVFAGRWLTTVMAAPGSIVKFKFLKTPKAWDPNFQPPKGEWWEYDGSTNRELTVAPLAVHIVNGIYKWGQN